MSSEKTKLNEGEKIFGFILLIIGFASTIGFIATN